MKKLIEFDDIEKAKNILSIGDTASIKTLRSYYIDLVKSNHPDKFPDGYKLLMDYCENYEISFKMEDFIKTKKDSKFDDFMKEWF